MGLTLGLTRQLAPSAAEKIEQGIDIYFPSRSTRRNQLANGVTIGGGAMMIIGCYLFKKGLKAPGLLLMGTGLLADDLDGDLARYTGSANQLGKRLDATTDKIKAAVLLTTLHSEIKTRKGKRRDKHIDRLAALGVYHGVNAGLNSFVELKTHGNSNSSKAGKTTAWLNGVYLMSAAVEVATDSQPALRKAAEIIGDTAYLIGLGTGAIAVAGYYADAEDAAKYSQAIANFVNT